MNVQANAQASAVLPLAAVGDRIGTASLGPSIGQLTTLGYGLGAIITDNCTIPELRKMVRRKHSLLDLAACLGTADIALVAGHPKVGAVHIDAAVAAALHAIRRTPTVDENLAKVDALLDFFVAVVSGDGQQMVSAAGHLKTALAGAARTPGASGIGRPDGHAPTRPWEAAPYVLFPMRGTRSPEMAQIQLVPGPIATPLLEQVALHQQTPPERPRVLHAIHDDGVKLAELSGPDIVALKKSVPGIRILPLVLYEVCRQPMLTLLRNVPLATTLAVTGLSVKVVRKGSAAPVAGARVIAFTDFAKRVGAQGVSDLTGALTLELGASSAALEVLVAYGPNGFWGLYQKGITLKDGAQLTLAPIELTVADYLATVYAGAPFDAGKAVTVGVIDTGVDAQHPDLSVAGGGAFVVAENDSGGAGPAAALGEHGSHVAGIIASHGKAPAGKRGVAPAVKLMSYRVFPNAGGGATNYDIVRAIDRAVADGCDLLNLSLGGPTRDEAVREAIKAAFDKGTLCIVAAGNDARSPVSYPARWPEALAVSALGKLGTFPSESTEQIDAVAPFSLDDASVFVAGFSNIGAEIDLSGPGVGIVSTVPGGAYAVMSGTSMACPAVTGAAAALLSGSPEILQMPRDGVRALAMLARINGAAKSMGFTREFQGLGMPS